MAGEAVVLEAGSSGQVVAAPKEAVGSIQPDLILISDHTTIVLTAAAAGLVTRESSLSKFLSLFIPMLLVEYFLNIYFAYAIVCKK